MFQIAKIVVLFTNMDYLQHSDSPKWINSWLFYDYCLSMHHIHNNQFYYILFVNVICIYLVIKYMYQACGNVESFLSKTNGYAKQTDKQ